MILFYLAILVLALWRCEIIKDQSSNELFNGALNRTRTDAIKGIFILVVFCRHIFPYIAQQTDDFNYLDQLYITADGMVRQLLVVMFLFYSGYGVAESISDKGATYVNSMPRKRILTTFLNFSVAVMFFIALALILGHELTIKQCMLSLVGWKSVGNSNWYIFCILVLYGFTYVSYKLFTGRSKPLFALSFLSIVYIFVIPVFRGSYWVDTTFAYVTGVAFSTYKDKIEQIFKNYYWFSIIVLIILFSAFYLTPYQQFTIATNIYAIFFSLIVVLITMKVKIENRSLIWLGRNLFPLYIYQRIPMIALLAIADGALVVEYPYLYVILSLVFTLLIAFGYKHIAISERHINFFPLSRAD